MNNYSMNLQEFAAKLKSYRETLLEMNALTESEIDRLNPIRITLSQEDGMSEKDAAIFINKQMYSYLNKLASLVTSVPNFSEHGCFTTNEVQAIQEQALKKLKELGCHDIAGG